MRYLNSVEKSLEESQNELRNVETAYRIASDLSDVYEAMYEEARAKASDMGERYAARLDEEKGLLKRRVGLVAKVYCLKVVLGLVALLDVLKRESRKIISLDFSPTKAYNGPHGNDD